MQKKRPSTLDLYRKFFMDKCDERLGFFKVLWERCALARGLYPGSFVHVTPSFVIPEMVYVDTDKRATRFFGSSEVLQYVKNQKTYPHEPVIRFHSLDFTAEIPEKRESFDVLISLYAGLISKYCVGYLKTGGILVTNNSHAMPGLLPVWNSSA